MNKFWIFLVVTISLILFLIYARHNIFLNIHIGQIVEYILDKIGVHH